MGQGIAHFVWQGGAVLALGTALFLWRAGPAPPILARWRARLYTVLAAACALALVGGGVVLAVEAERILGHLPTLNDPLWINLLGHTRLGQVWLAKQGLLLLLIGTCAFAPRLPPTSVMGGATLLGAAFLAIGQWAGHGGATPPVAQNLPLHAVHAVLAGAWLGALPAWALLLRAAGVSAAEHAYLGRALLAFSRFAMGAIAALVASGLLIAWRQFGGWPALFGTGAGGLLWLKLGLLAIALAAAWRLRRDHLAALVHAPAPSVRRAALRVHALEAIAAFALFAVALELTRTAPGAHQPIAWWLPFRLAPAVTWDDPFARLQTAIGLGIALSALPLWTWRQRGVALAAALLGSIACAEAWAVRAYPDTYLRPAVAYTARSISRGAALFEAHCASCHGADARGDPRPLGPALAPPADLSRHTAQHTAGDMFYWLTHGVGRGMPGFGNALGADARWDLVNFLRAFADGHRARILTSSIEAARPWLTAPNFTYLTAGGASSELAAQRAREAILLVFAGGAETMPRLRALDAAAAELRAGGLGILLVPTAGDCAALAAAARLPCVAAGAGWAVDAYRLLARTLQHPAARGVLAPTLARGEFLIDRYGYLRARWLPDEDEAPWSPATLQAVSAALAAEPEVRPAPDEHVH